MDGKPETSDVEQLETIAKIIKLSSTAQRAIVNPEATVAMQVHDIVSALELSGDAFASVRNAIATTLDAPPWAELSDMFTVLLTEHLTTRAALAEAIAHVKTRWAYMPAAEVVEAWEDALVRRWTIPFSADITMRRADDGAPAAFLTVRVYTPGLDGVAGERCGECPGCKAVAAERAEHDAALAKVKTEIAKDRAAGE